MTRAMKYALKLADVAAIMGDPVGPDRLEMMADLLACELEEEEFWLACKMVMLKEMRLPPPAKFISLAKGQARDKAEQLMGRLFDAIRKFGWNNEADARGYIGNAGWEAVRRMGGWTHVCTLEMNQLNTYRAQFLNSAEKAIEEVKREEIIQSLPEGGKVLELASGLANDRDLNKKLLK